MEGAVIRLIVKAPNQQIEDQVVKCDLDWTVGKLKDHLAEVYPSKPKISEQKVIYSGQLLDDSMLFKDVLRSYDNCDRSDQSYTIHLVCASRKSYPRMSCDSNQPSVMESTNAGAPAETQSPTGRAAEQQGAPENDSGESMRPNEPFQHYAAHQYYNQLNSQQIAWMQQAYTHYLTQYMQIIAAQGVQVQSSSIPYVQPVETNVQDSANNGYRNNNNNNNNNNDNNNEQQQRPARQEAAENNPVVNNGVGDDAAGALNRDWLDLFYMLSRVTVLFSIVYFYSSPLRCLIVTFLGFAIYLYQTGFFRAQPALLVDNINGRVNNNNQVLQNEVVDAPVMPPQEPVQPPAVQQPEARTNPNEENDGERPPGALAFTWTFFSSFFASLIPDQPNVI